MCDYNNSMDIDDTLPISNDLIINQQTEKEISSFLKKGNEVITRLHEARNTGVSDEQIKEVENTLYEAQKMSMDLSSRLKKHFNVDNHIQSTVCFYFYHYFQLLIRNLILC
jgi:uncharacterized membrane protein